MEIIKMDIAPFKEVVQWDDYIGHDVIRAAKWRNGDVDGFLDIDRMRFFEKEEFDRNYKKVYSGMSFGMAMDCALDNYFVARSSWDESGEYVTMVYPNTYSMVAGDKVAHSQYVGINRNNGRIEPYTPTQSDMIATDWKVLKETE
jgi:hypothetical protein